MSGYTGPPPDGGSEEKDNRKTVPTCTVFFSSRGLKERKRGTGNTTRRSANFIEKCRLQSVHRDPFESVGTRNSKSFFRAFNYSKRTFVRSHKRTSVRTYSNKNVGGCMQFLRNEIRKMARTRRWNGGAFTDFSPKLVDIRITIVTRKKFTR